MWLLKQLRMPEPGNHINLFKCWKQNFLDFKVLSQCTAFSNVPYNKLVQISYENNSNFVKYKLTFSAANPPIVLFLKHSTRQNVRQTFLENIPSPTVQPPPPDLLDQKVVHIRSLLNHFSVVDLQFWKCIIKKF